MNSPTNNPTFKHKPNPSNIDEFLEAAQPLPSPVKTTIQDQRAQTTAKPQKRSPWDTARPDVIKPFNLRLSEPYIAMLRYISENTPHSMQSFCLKVLEPAIKAEAERLIERPKTDGKP